MDEFTEQLIKKKKGAREWGIMGAALLGGIVLLYLFLIFPPLASMLPLAIVGVAVGFWFVISQQNIEYEYCITNGDIDVDEIIAQRKRRRIVSVRGAKLQAIMPYTADCLAGKKVDRFVMAAPSLAEPGNWVFTYTSKKSGFTAVVFQPNAKVLRMIYAGQPRLAQLAMEKAGYDPTAPV